MKRLITGAVAAFLVASSYTTFSQAQEIPFKFFSTENGLSSNGVLAMVKDNHGFLWFGTTNGLDRYDGYEIRAFVNDPTDSNTISDNWINCLLSTARGEFWIGTQNGGLNLFDSEYERFISYRNNPNDPTSLSSNNVRSLHEDADGTLWVATRGGGLCCKKPGSRGFIHFENDSSDAVSISSNIVHSILRDSHGDLWIGTAAGIDRLSGGQEKSNGFVHYRLVSPDKMARWTASPSSGANESGSHSSVLSIYEDRNRRLFIGAGDHGLFMYDRNADAFLKYRPGKSSRSNNETQADSSYWVECMHEDRNGRLWIGTWNNDLNVIDENTGTLSHFRHIENDPQSLCSNQVYSLCEDDAGDMWFGTDVGISVYDVNRKPFFNFLHDKDNPASISGGASQLCVDPYGGLWIAVQGSGLDYLPRGSKTFTHFKHQPRNKSSLSSDEIDCLSCGEDGTVWVGSVGSGIDRLDRPTGKFKHFLNKPSDPSSLGENTIYELYEDREGNLWVGTASCGLDKLDRSTGKFIHFRNRSDDSTSFSGECVWSTFEDSKGRLWIGTKSAGLNLYARRTNSFVCYKNDPNNPHSLSSNYVRTIHEDLDGTIWIGTTNGLDRFNDSTNDFTTYTTKDGLPDNRIEAILNDKNNRLWVATKKITVFDPRTGKCRNYDRRDGILCGPFAQDCACMGKDGEMFFGGDNGFTGFYPDSMSTNSFVPPLALTQFKIFENPSPIPLEYVKGITLSYRENYFSFEFAALSFTAPEKNKYRYKLEAFDKDWISSGTRHYAAYTGVPPGDYIFRVQGSNNDGVWNTAGIAIPIHIIPPFWGTWWFRVSSILAILFVAVFSINRRIEFHKKQTRAQQELSAQLIEHQEMERKRIGRSLHDSLAQNLLVVKNLAVIGLEAVRNNEDSGQQLNEISALSSEILSEVREIAYDLRPYHLDQLGLTGAIRSILARVSSSSKIEFTEYIDDVNNLLPKELEINAFRIIQEAVNNVIKHSHASHASVRIKRERNVVEFTVSDDGVGFDVGRQGFGLTGMGERVRILGGTMEVKSAAREGTAIAVKVPVRGGKGHKGVVPLYPYPQTP